MGEIRVGERIMGRNGPRLDFKSFFDFTEKAMRQMLTVRQSAPHTIGTYLFLSFEDKQEILWRDYLMSEPENDLHHVAFEINCLIKDPRSDYFIAVSGDINQDYDNNFLNMYTNRNSIDILSLSGGSILGGHLNKTFKIVRNAGLRILSLKQI